MKTSIMIVNDKMFEAYINELSKTGSYLIHVRFYSTKEILKKINYTQQKIKQVYFIL